MNTFLKSTAIAATLAMGASVATAAGGFGFQTTVDDNSAITLDMINADAAGTVVIYDYSGGEFGEMIGMASVNEGANADVIVPLDNSTATILAAVLYEGEVTSPTDAAAWIELDVSDDS